MKSFTLIVILYFVLQSYSQSCLDPSIPDFLTCSGLTLPDDDPAGYTYCAYLTCNLVECFNCINNCPDWWYQWGAGATIIYQNSYWDCVNICSGPNATCLNGYGNA